MKRKEFFLYTWRSVVFLDHLEIMRNVSPGRLRFDCVDEVGAKSDWLPSCCSGALADRESQVRICANQCHLCTQRSPVGA
jgi:hypothetical protein